MPESPAVALILVNYRTPELVLPALEASARDLRSIGLGVEAHVVDNSGELRSLAGAGGVSPAIHRFGHNLGYAEAINRAVAATSAPRLIIQNPDVEVCPGCLPALLRALEGAAVAGPRFFWDAGRRMLMPPTERRTVTDALVRALGAGTGAWRALARRRWRRHAWVHWEAREPVLSYELSGALLAIRRDAWDSVGPMDTAYRLYFEEQDWLLRARRCRLLAVHVPAAVAIHAGGASVARQPEAAAWFVASHGRFRRQHYGAAATRALTVLARPSARRHDEKVAVIDRLRGRPSVPLPDGTAWVELSPQERGFPAAAEKLASARSSWSPPDEVWQRLRPGGYRLTMVDSNGRELGGQLLHRAESEAQNRSVSANV